MISNSPSMKAPAQSSASQNTRAGSSSRPGKAMYPIKTTAPMDPMTLGRDTPDSLHKKAPAPKGM